MPDIPSQPRRFPRDTVAVVAPTASFVLIVSTDRPTENCILIEAVARTDREDLLRITLSREDARHLASEILKNTDPRPADDETPATDSAASLYEGIETRDAFVRVSIRTGWNPQEKTGATDARIIAEARQVLAETSTAWPGSEGTR